MEARVRLTRSVYDTDTPDGAFTLLARQGQTAEVALERPRNVTFADQRWGLCIRPEGSDTWLLVPPHIVEFIEAGAL